MRERGGVEWRRIDDGGKISKATLAQWISLHLACERPQFSSRDPSNPWHWICIPRHCLVERGMADLDDVGGISATFLSTWSRGQIF